MTPDDTSSPANASPVTALNAFEHKVEAAFEDALHAAERSLVRRLGARSLRVLRVAWRALLIALVVLYFAFGALWLATRYWLMPRIDQYRPWLEQEASRLMDTRVQLAQIDSGWRGFHPRLRLRNVQIFDRAGRPALTLPQLDATLSWFSVPSLQVQFRDLVILAPELEVQRDADGRFSIAGFVIDPAARTDDSGIADWVLSQRHIGIRDARVRYTDSATATVHDFEAVDFDFRRGVINNHFSFGARPPAALGGPIDVRGEYRRPWLERAADIAHWTGRLFVQMDYADVAQVAQLARALPPGMSIDSAQGALRAWLEFDQSRIERVTADLALVDVDARLGADLPPLRVAQLQGRVAQREWGSSGEGGQEITVQGLALKGADLALAPVDARLRVTRAADDKPQHGLFEASSVSLTTLSALARHLPLAPGWHEAVARYGVRGNLSNLRYTWNGDAQQPAQYTLRTGFDTLAMNGQAPDPPLTATGRPRPGLPGFENLAGTIELDQRGGTAEIRARTSVLVFPGVFEEPRLAFDAVTATARWNLSPSFELQVESFAGSNRDVEVTAQAGYRRGGKGPGIIDVKGDIKRAEVNQVYRYLPLVLNPKARTWLQHALVAGQAHDGSVRLKGDLADFPFAQPGSGEFRIAARFSGGTLDYVPRSSEDTQATRSWPMLTAIDGDLLLDRKRLEVNGRAQVFSTELAGVHANVADLAAPDARLLIDGKTSGPLADQVRFVNESPVGGALGGFLARAAASGNATLDLKLDIPLRHPRDTTAQGTVDFAGNDVALREDMPPLTRVGGQLGFTERTLRLTGLNGNFAGGVFRAEGGTRGDGAIEITGSGTATLQGARRLLEPALPDKLIELASGTLKYNASVSIKGRRSEIRVDSDLAGVALELPDPLRKAAAEALSLRFEVVPRDDAGAGDMVRVSAGTRLAVLLERARDASGAMRVQRGAVSIGEADSGALALPDDGLRAAIAVPRLNIDRWQALLEGQAETAGSALNVITARIGELTIGGKAIANVVLGASRTDGAWVANVVSDHATGAVTWNPPRPGNPGRISARLARLSIPEQQRNNLTELLDAPPTELPEFDISVADFQLAGRKLGRLELSANNAPGAAGAWQLQKLELATPEAHMLASGTWERPGGDKSGGDKPAGPRRMALKFGLDFSDAGALLARLGHAGALRGGDGKLEGELAWRGSPLAIDFASLGGSLTLGTAKGQFLKAEAGAARLLGVLSLQSLPRRLTLDFRDVFSEGFAFDAINATASVDAGVLTTRDFKMRGANATVLIEGTADLKRENQNLHVLVLPEINAGSASLVYALLANPAIGLGTFLAQLVLRDPLSKAFSHEYDVTGSWADPQVARRERTPSLAGAPPK